MIWGYNSGSQIWQQAFLPDELFHQLSPELKRKNQKIDKICTSLNQEKEE